jgi:hypothetical protein
MLCKKQDAQPARNPDELPPLHDPEELTNEDGGSYRDMNDLVKPGTPPPNYEHVAPTHVAPTAAETQKDERRPIYKKQNSCPGEISAKRFT